MRTFSTIRSACMLGVAALGFGIAAAAAQSYPTRHLTMTVPFGAGSGSDIIARIFSARRCPRSLGKQVVIENVSGGGGTSA